MALLENSNLVIRLALELCALLAFGYWGFKTHVQTVERWGYGVGLPLVVALGWALLIAPGSVFEAPLGVRLGLEAAVFGGASLALYHTDHRTLAVILVVVAVANRVLMLAWDQ